MKIGEIIKNCFITYFIKLIHFEPFDPDNTGKCNI